MIEKKRVTIKHIAHLAGVSTQTISRVLNDRPDVSPDTRERVKQIIAEQGYRPSEVARSLIQQRSFTLGVITAGLNYAGPSMILNGITDESEELGYSILIKKLPKFDTDDVEPIFQSLMSRHVDGIIWAVPEAGDNLGWIKQNSPNFQVPIIFLTTPPQPDLPSAYFDNYSGGKTATEHLLDQGYHHIGHITGPLDWLSARQRKEGWQDALEQAGMSSDDIHWVEGNWSPSSGERAFNRLLEEYPQMDAVFVANDQMAISVLQIACKRGTLIPQELGVVGFDGLAESAYYWPPLTTMFQDLHYLGCIAAKELVEIIESSRKGMVKDHSEPVVLQPKLIARGSSSIKP